MSIECLQRLVCAAAALIICPVASAVVLGSVGGTVQDSDGGAIAAASVTLQSTSSDYKETAVTRSDGSFEFSGVPVGQYRVAVEKSGFQSGTQEVVVTSREAPSLRFQLAVGTMSQSVEVRDQALTPSPETMTPTTVISRAEIRDTPGADLTNSMNMITDYVPGSWMTHDQLHVRGGHQVTWAIDGVPIPNTNIASNVGPQIDPKDIDYLEAERGGYSSVYGDRTYGVFNVVPRTGFERNNEAEFYTTYGTFHQTN